ncbi:MAG: AAA family ATPase [Oscillospiraceae bacterium]
MSIVIAVTNQKGGVGKTSTVSALSGVFTQMGKDVLAIDLDPQGNLTFSLGANDEHITIHDVLTGEVSIKDAIQHTKNCDVIAANILLSGSELELTTIGREYILKERLEPVLQKYDYILIDTPPALSILTINAYTAADDLIIPMTPEILSLQGIAQLKDTIFAVKKYYNKSLSLRGILLTKYNPRILLTKEVEEMAEIVAAQLGTAVLTTKISPSISVAEAPAHQKTIVKYSPRAKATREYIALVKEMYNLEI